MKVSEFPNQFKEWYDKALLNFNYRRHADSCYRQGFYEEAFEAYSLLYPKVIEVEEKMDNARKSSLYPHKKYNKFGFKDLLGEWKIKAQFQEVQPFNESLAGVKSESGLWGFINRDGSYVIKAKYDEVFPFEHGLAKVRLGKRYFLINKQGVEIGESSLVT